MWEGNIEEVHDFVKTANIMDRIQFKEGIGGKELNYLYFSDKHKRWKRIDVGYIQEGNLFGSNNSYQFIPSI